MNNLKDKNVLITGGGSGIGKIITRLMLERKAKVIIWDISQENMIETLNALSGKGTVFGYKVDVSDMDQIRETANKVTHDIGVVDVLINNAGIVVGKFFHEHSVPDIAKALPGSCKNQQ